MRKVLKVRGLPLLFRSDGSRNALEDLGSSVCEVADQVGSGFAEGLSYAGQGFQCIVGNVNLYLEEFAGGFSQGVDCTSDIDVCSV